MVKASDKPVSIKDVAKYADVSISTVSNVLNHKKTVSPELTERVRQAVEELGYKTNLIGRQLKTGRSQQIAVVVSSLTSCFFPDLLKSIQDCADSNGYIVSVYGTKGILEKERSILNQLRAQRYDGVLISSCLDVDQPEAEEYLDYLHKLNFSENPMHIICLESAISPKLDAVVVNDTDGILKLTEYLIGLGKKHFAHISPPLQYLNGKNRYRGFLTALMLNDIPADPDLIAEGNYTCHSGYEAMDRILSQNKPVDAVVVGNDQMAIGAISCLKQHDIAVPDQVAVVGFNDNSPASLIQPSLTTMHVPKAEMGKFAFELFERRVNRDTSARLMIQLDGELVIRNSTDKNVVTHWDLEW